MENENFDLENRDLDDIVLDKSKGKGGLKRWALIGGSLLMLFIIVIVSYKLFNSPQPAQDKLVETEKIELQQKDEEFEDVPIIQENEEIEPLEKPQPQPQKIQPIQETQKQPIQKVAPTPVKKEIKQVAPKPAPKPKPKSKHQSAPKTKPKPAPKPKAKPSPKPKKVAKRGKFFIQVGAFSKYAPSKHFLEKIKKAGFSYQFKTVIQGDKKITRVLVGPFKSKKEAYRALKKIKKMVTPSAFIKRIG